MIEFIIDDSPRFDVINGGISHIQKTEAELLEAGVRQGDIDLAKAKVKLAEVNKQAYDCIVKHYPEWKQLNITATGTEAEKTTMNTFIAAVRGWANSPEPVLADALAIQP